MPTEEPVACKPRCRPACATKDADATKAIAYLRCSTQQQELSPKVQRDAIRTWAASAGVTVVAWHEDIGVSGGAELEKRPGLLAATEALRAEGAGVLVVAKRDRLARDVLESLADAVALLDLLAEALSEEPSGPDGAHPA